MGKEGRREEKREGGREEKREGGREGWEPGPAFVHTIVFPSFHPHRTFLFPPPLSPLLPPSLHPFPDFRKWPTSFPYSNETLTGLQDLLLVQQHVS